jgi:hypothetical protein
MSINDLVISLVGDTHPLYSAAPLNAGGTIQLKILNSGTSNLSSLGIYIIPSTSLGDVDYPSDNPPETDYQDLLTWGEAVIQAVELTGGLILTVPINGPSTSVERVGRTNGSSFSTMIPIQDIDAGDFITIDIELELPPGVLTRRLYIDFVIAQGS